MTEVNVASTRPEDLIGSIRRALFVAVGKDGLHWRRDHAFRTHLENGCVLVSGVAAPDSQPRPSAPTMGGVPVSEECVEDRPGEEGWAILMSGEVPLVKLRIRQGS